MKNLQENINNITSCYDEMCKNVDMLFRINVDMLKKDKFDLALYEKAQSIEDKINMLDVEIKESSIKTIAMFQPAAVNLRNLITFIESSKILERMGDLLLDSLLLVKEIGTKNENINDCYISLDDFILKINKIFHKYFESFIEKDNDKAHDILTMDEEMNKIRREIDSKIVNQMKQSPEAVDTGVLLLLVNKKYERISDKIIQLTMSSIYTLNGENMRIIEILKKKQK